MDISNILQATENLRTKFCCEKCKNINFKCKRIKICGHIFCNSCISSDGNCFSCDTKFKPSDVIVDNTSETILNSLDVIRQELQNNNAPTVSSCSVQLAETNDDPVTNDDQIHLDADVSNIKASFGECDCFQYYEMEHTHEKQCTKTEFIDKKNAVGETKLHRACKKGNLTEVDALLQAGASTNAQDYAAWTPLHEAIEVGNTVIIERLLTNGSVVNAPGYNYDTPMHKAVVQNNKEIALLLLKYGANINSRNYEGLRPWDLATSEMKSILSSTKSGDIIVQIPDMQLQYNIFVIGNITDELKSALDDFSKLIKINLVVKLNEQVTHVVVNSVSKLIEPSYEFMLAVLYALPVVTIEWIHVCNSFGKLMDFKEYIVIGTEDFNCDIITKTLMNKYKLNPKLFNGCHFFLSKTKKSYNLNGAPLSREKLQLLITAGGGALLKREPHLPALSQTRHYPWHASSGSSIEQCCHYIIYDPASQPELKYNMRELRHLPYQWIFDSVLQFHLVSPELMETN